MPTRKALEVDIEEITRVHYKCPFCLQWGEDDCYGMEETLKRECYNCKKTIIINMSDY